MSCSWCGRIVFCDYWFCCSWWLIFMKLRAIAHFKCDFAVTCEVLKLSNVIVWGYASYTCFSWLYFMLKTCNKKLCFLLLLHPHPTSHKLHGSFWSNLIQWTCAEFYEAVLILFSFHHFMGCFIKGTTVTLVIKQYHVIKGFWYLVVITDM
jgi:hypothetical protein